MPNNLLLNFIEYLKGHGVSLNSLKFYKSDITNFTSWLILKLRAMHGVYAETLEECIPFLNNNIASEYKVFLKENNHSLKTINRRLSTLRSFAGFLDNNFMSGIVNESLNQTPGKSNSIIKNFDKYLIEEEISKNTRKNYLSDIRKYLVWAEKSPNSNIKQYLDMVLKSSSRPAYDRALSSVKKYYAFKGETFVFPRISIPKNAPYAGIQALILNKLAGKPKVQRVAHRVFYSRPNWYKKYHTYPISTYINFAVLIMFCAVSGYAIYDQAFKKSSPSLAFPTALTRPNRYLSFQGRLTSNTGNPVTTATNIVFKLYDDASAGSTLWNSGTCSITPDSDGIFSTLLGSTCGTELASSVFSENSSVWAGVTVSADAEATPRIQIATVAYALNSETLQGYPASSSATANTVPVINNSGNLVIAVSSPTIQSTSGTFGISSQAMTISTADTTNGAISINPDGTGSLNLTFEGTAAGGGAGGFVNATNANITSGSLYYGAVASNATGYNLLQLQSGSSLTDKFVVTAAGNTTIAGSLNANGNTTLGDAITDTLTFTGRVAVDSDLIPIGTTGTNDLGSSGLPWDNVYGAVLYQGANQVCDLSGNCTGSSIVKWRENLGTLSPYTDSLDVLIGSNATSSAKFAFTGVNSGTPTASISGTTNIATFIDGNGNISSTNRNNLTLGNSATYNSTGNILLNPNGTGNVGIGTTTPSAKFQVTDTATTTGNEIYATASAITSGNILKLGQGGDVNFTGNVIYGDIDNTGQGGIGFTGNFLKFDNAGGTKFTLGSSGILTLANSETIDNTTDGTVNIGTTTLKLTGGTTLVSDQTTVSAFNTTTTSLTLGGAATTLNLQGASAATVSIGNANTTTALNLTSGTGDVAISSTDLITLFPTNNVRVGNATDYASFNSSGDITYVDADGAASITGPAGGAFSVVAGASQALTLTGNAASVWSTTGNLTLRATSGNVLVDTATAGDVTVGPDVSLGTGDDLFFQDGTMTAAVPLTVADTALNAALAQGIVDAINDVYDIANGAGGSSGFWGQTSGGTTGGVLYPLNNTVDLLIGATATTSAKFAFKNILTGTPTMDVSAQATNIAVKDATANALQILEGTNAYFAITTSNGTENMSFGNTGTNPSFSFLGSGTTTLGGDLAVNGATSADITSTTTTATLFNSTVTTLDIADSTTTKVIDIGGVTNSGTDTVSIATNGTAADVIAVGNTNASTTLALTGGDDWSMSATGILTMSASAAQTTAILVTDTDYTNALSVGDNSIIGTTGILDYTNFDIDTNGNSKFTTLALGTGTIARTDRLFDINTSTAITNAVTYTGTTQRTLTGTLTGNITDYGLYNYLTVNATDDQFSHTSSALQSSIDLSNGNTIDTMYGGFFASVSNSNTLSADISRTATNSAGIRANAYNNGTGTVANQYGSWNTSYNASTGTVTNALGSYNYVYNNNATGTITTAIGSQDLAFTNIDGAVITTEYGTYGQAYELPAQTTGGVTTAYGGWFNGQDATTSYGLYAIGVQNTANTETFTNLYGAYTDCQSNGANVTVTNCYGVRGNIVETLGTITNGYAGYFNTSSALSSAYGVYANVTGASTTNYGVYSNVSGASTNYSGIFAGGNVGIGDTTPDAFLEVLGTTEQLRLTNVDGTTDARFTVDSTGDLTIDMLGSGTTDQLILADADTLNIGGNGSSDVAYNVIGDSTTGASANMNSDNDLYIEGNLEVDGTIYGAVVGTVPWSEIDAPTGTLSLTMPAGDETTFTVASTTQTGFTWTSSTLTSGILAKYALTGSSAVATPANSGSLLTLTSSTTGFTGATQTLSSIYSSGANSNASAVIRGLSSNVVNTGTTNTNTAGYFAANAGSTANYGIQTGAITTAGTTNAQLDLGAITTTGGTTSYGINVGALSGTGTTNYGININTLTSTGTTSIALNIGGLTGAATTKSGIAIGALSGTSTNAYGINLSTLTGGTTGNYQINTGALTAVASATNTQLNLGTVSGTAASSTNYGINIGAMTSTGTSNTGLYVGAVSGATANYAAIFAGGNVGIGDTSPAALLTVGSGDLFQVDSSGNISATGVGQFGGTTVTTYSRFGTASTGHSLSAANDVLIEGKLELNDTLFLDGGTIANSAGNATITLSSTPTTASNTLAATNWLIENSSATGNVGQAALMINQQKGGDLVTASQSAVTKWTIAQETATANLEKLTSSVITSGNVLYATASAITSGNIIKLGQGGNFNFTGNAIYADLDNTGQGGIGFTGNFLKFDNAAATKFTVASTGNITTAGDIAVNGADITTTATGTATVFDTNATTLNIGSAATTINLADATITGTIDIGGVTNSGTTTVNIATNGTAADVLTIGNTNAATTLALTGGDDWSISTAGLITTANDIAVNGADITTTATGTATVFDTNALTLTMGGAATAINLAGASGTNVTIGNSGGAAQLNLTSGTGAQTHLSSVATGTGLTSAFVFKDTALSSGDMIYATSSGALTSGNLFKLGTGGNTNFTGNVIYGDIDNTGQGGIGFTGNFLKFDNATATKFTVASTGNITTAGDIAVNGNDITSTGALTVTPGAGTNLNIALSTTGDFAVNTSQLHVDTSTTNVGIGTATPLVKLDVAGSAKVSTTATSVLTGSINPTASTSVTGVNTLFLTELAVGDRITVTGETRTVATIASDTSLTVTTAFTDTANDTSPDKLPSSFVATDTTNALLMVLNNVGNLDLEGKIEFDIPTTGDTTIGVCKDLADGSTDVQFQECNGTAGDIAEYYQAEADLLPGDVVVLNKSSATTQLIKSSQSYESTVFGVVSTYPVGQFGKPLGHETIEEGKHPTAIGLIGKLPVKVSLINGPIKIGDPLTTSSVSGAAMKATKAGKVLGYALESFDGSIKVSEGVRQQEQFRNESVVKFNSDPVDPTEENVGKILMYANTGWYDPDVYLTDTGDLNIAKVADGNYQLTNKGSVVDRIGAFANMVVANIKAGIIETQNLVAENFKTKLISPLAGGTDITVKLGSEATPSGKFAVQDSAGTEIASIDNLGNANFAGDVHAKNIDQIQELLTQVKVDQSILMEATAPANLSDLITSNLYVTNHAAVNSLLVNSDLTTETINSLSGPLKLQSLAVAPIELMAGLVTIDTQGNVNIAGNLNVAGKITSPVAQFDNLSIQNLTIAASQDATESGVISNGEITTNATAGKAIIPTGISEIIIKNPKVTDYTLVYVTPTSSTENNVLYVKSKQVGQFVVGFSNPIDVDVSFNWWIVQVE